jgi:murein DD-endopeptidase MepM/ murein hydrolase activator NlpD
MTGSNMQTNRKPQATPVGKTNKPTIPRKHILAASLSVLMILFVLLFVPDDNASERLSTPIALNIASETTATLAQTEPVPQEPEIIWKSLEVKKGDTLSDIFKRAKLSPTDMMNIINSGPEGKQLTRIFPGQSISYSLTPTGSLSSLKYHLSALETTEFTLNGSDITAKHEKLTPDIYEDFKQARIDSSLFLAGQKAGLSQNQIMEIASIFSGVIDFILDPRTGDSFSVLYEKLYLNGEYIGDGEILAAQYIGEDGELTAYRYLDSSGNIGYYSPEGVSMRKAFLRAPLDFTRISSNFDMRRKHPIHKLVKAHRGIDYAAPRGTPIYAAGDGRVIKAGYSRANGNFVFIQHGDQYTTKYIHLDKRKVKTGQRVKQKQIIGTVGSTGYATGPHLHYEFLVNGVHRNPRTIVDKLPKAKSIDPAELDRFIVETKPLAEQFTSYQHRFARSANSTGTGE